ncbi:hypothetical protein F506_12665 [Herbaspirillum hiltneri N3]|uniref:DUF1120 domain-containing protein n=1 Tax=Herbaspirillum hiltneri N3 TaxID=1262470 RepID=A0ABN4HXM3_9BURK|nr:DUF1120 domain-containing protein [Herbaspirillum hiltneri]AKZ63409.1 hypothetical protein F506_12665 [Herbaspirillum hiltneri N3]
MNKQVTLLCTLAASLLFSFSAQAAETAEMKVKGSILPPACTPTFAGGNTVDYETIPAKSLKSREYAKLETRSIPFTVTCNAKMRIGIAVTDNRATSRIDSGSFSSAHSFGLGSVDGKNVGNYVLALGPDVKVDGNNSQLVFFDTQGTGVSNFGSLIMSVHNTARFIYTALTAGQVWTFDMNLTAYLNKRENLNLTGSIPLDGSATIEVKYL